MKNWILIFFTILMVLSCKYALGQSEYCRYQDDFILDWTFFRGEIDTNSSFGAVSFVGIGYYFERFDSILAINIGAYFYPDSSWVRSKTATGLTHEIYHFKIAEIARRFMIKELSEIEISFSTVENLTENRLLNYSWYNEGEQALYDRETNYGLDEIKQNEFEIKIDNQLEILKNYNKSYLILYLNKDKEISYTEMSNKLPIYKTIKIGD